MDAAVGDEILERDAPDLTPHRIEAREDDRLGRVVDDEVDAGQLLEGADVAAFAADDAALEVVARDVDDRDRGLRGVVRGDPADGDADDVAGLAVRLFAGALLRFADDDRRVVAHVLLDAVEQDGLRLVRGHAGERLEPGLLLGDSLVELLLALGDLPSLAGQLVLALVERFGAALDGLLALKQTCLHRGDVLAALLALLLGLSLEVEDLVLRLEEHLFLHRLGLLLRVGEHALCELSSLVGLTGDDEAIDDEAEDDAGCEAEHECVKPAHEAPLPYREHPYSFMSAALVTRKRRTTNRPAHEIGVCGFRIRSMHDEPPLRAVACLIAEEPHTTRRPRSGAVSITFAALMVLARPVFRQAR